MNVKEEPLVEDYIEVYYFKGLVDAEVDCSVNFSSNEADSLGEVIISDKDYAQILNLIAGLQENTEWVNCNLDLQANIYSKGNARKRVCINRFNCMVSDEKQVFDNDSLAYLLRDYSGYYNYFDKESLSIFKELKTLGLPKNYKNLSADESSNTPAARIVIRPDRSSAEQLPSKGIDNNL